MFYFRLLPFLVSKTQKQKGEFMEELKIQIKKALAQRERLERSPMRLLSISMKMQQKQCKTETYYIIINKHFDNSRGVDKKCSL